MLGFLVLMAKGCCYSGEMCLEINSDAKLGHGSFGRVDFAGRKHGDSLLMCLCFIQEKNTIGLR